MLEGKLSVLAPINPDDIKADILVPVDLIDKIVRGPDDQLALFVIDKFLSIAKAGAASELDLHKNQKPLMFHDQVDFSMFVTIVRSQQLIAFCL